MIDERIRKQVEEDIKKIEERQESYRTIAEKHKVSKSIVYSWHEEIQQQRISTLQEKEKAELERFQKIENGIAEKSQEKQRIESEISKLSDQRDWYITENERLKQEYAYWKERANEISELKSEIPRLQSEIQGGKAIIRDNDMRIQNGNSTLREIDLSIQDRRKTINSLAKKYDLQTLLIMYNNQTKQKLEEDIKVLNNSKKEKELTYRLLGDGNSQLEKKLSNIEAQIKSNRKVTIILDLIEKPASIKEPNEEVLALSVAYTNGLRSYISNNSAKIKNSFGIELVVAQLQDRLLEALRH